MNIRSSTMVSASTLKVGTVAHDEVKLKLGHSFKPEPKYDAMLCVVKVKVAGVGSQDKIPIHPRWLLKSVQGSYREQSSSSSEILNHSKHL